MMRVWLACVLVAVWNGSSLSAMAWQLQTPTPFTCVSAHKRSRTTTTTATTRTTTQLFTTTSTHLYDLERRRLLQATAASLLGGGTASCLFPPQAAHAGGLLQFPIQPSVCPLKNKYHFMRAGPSELEMQGIYSTNPLFLTNRENALHASGETLILQALEQIIRKEPPTIAYHSLAANSMDTGDLIARQLNLGREKLLPEFTYLDPRGIGMWNDGDASLVKPAIFALDHGEAGERGMNGRPPSNIDGTPNETLNDQFIRLRQFLSLQESRTAGDVILVIFPDGTGPALLSCMIAGIPYEDCHALEFEPGEVRLDITPESVKKLFEEKKNDPHYLEILEQGKEELKILRQQEGKGGVVSLKESRENKVQADIEQAYQDKKNADTALETEKRKAQEERQRQIQMEYQEERRRSKPSESSSSKRVPAWKQQQQQASNPSSISAVSGDASSTTTKLDTKSLDLPVVAGLSAAGVGAVGLMAMGATTSTNNNDGAVSKEGPPDAPSTTQANPPAPAASPPTEVAATVDDDTLMEPENKDRVDDVMSSMTSEQEAGNDTTGRPMVDRDPLDQPISMNGDGSSTTTKSVEDALEELATAEQAMKDALVEAADQKSRQQQQGGSLFDTPVPTITTTQPKSVEEMIDDGADDWLRIMAEIRDEEDVEENTSMAINGSGDLYDQ